jgi:uncharacterized protein
MSQLAVRELTRNECLALLHTETTGQLALTRHALPAIIPARFVVRDNQVIVHLWTGLRSAPWRDGEIVALQVCHFDDDKHEGWSVSVTGAAHGTPNLALDTDVPHAPWVAEGGGDLIALATDIIWGERLTPTDQSADDHHAAS